MPREPLGLKTCRVSWPRTWRIIASRYPPINLFERISPNPAVWEALIELEQLTNPRLRNDVGEIRLVPPDRRVSGPNASWVMAAFTHVNPLGSRFSNGTFGVYYAAKDLETAIRETAHHFARYASDSLDQARREDMRVLLGSIDHDMDDVNSLDTATRSAVLDKDSYVASQAFGQGRRNDGSDGLVYPSVRHHDGQCIAAFWPDVASIPVQERHLQYEWDGTRVRRYFDFKMDKWVLLS